ncbi:hypothetical protein [Okeania sp. SIO2F4]|nr:hypothetical protein [Okeania sp. SIO2F4]MDJ0517659.1 hypothetical protein [Trichodesmium sp. MO_231.B1]
MGLPTVMPETQFQREFENVRYSSQSRLEHYLFLNYLNLTF